MSTFFEDYKELIQNGNCCGDLYWEETDQGLIILDEYVHDSDAIVHYRAIREAGDIVIFDAEVEHLKTAHASDWQIALLTGEVYKWTVIHGV